MDGLPKQFTNQWRTIKQKVTPFRTAAERDRVERFFGDLFMVSLDRNEVLVGLDYFFFISLTFSYLKF
jgi:hypothetical protein